VIVQNERNARRGRNRLDPVGHGLDLELIGGFGPQLQHVHTACTKLASHALERIGGDISEIENAVEPGVREHSLLRAFAGH
jgi:hypothetical protein